MWMYLTLVYLVLSKASRTKRRREECAYIAARSWGIVQTQLDVPTMLAGAALTYAASGVLVAVWRVLP